MKTSTAIPVPEPTALYQPVEWVRKCDQADNGRYQMLSTIRDLAAGVALALQLVERADIQNQLGDTPIIDGSDSARLPRMSIAAMNVIEEFVDAHFDEMHDNAAAQRQIAKDNAK